jgi:hypothetical protein
LAKIGENFDHKTSVFLEKRQIFRQKLAKIGENFDHNIDRREMILMTKISVASRWLMSFRTTQHSSKTERRTGKLSFSAGLPDFS